MTVIVETFTTPNKITKSGLPLRWRWRIFDATDEDRSQFAKGRHSFQTESKALDDIHEHAVVPSSAVLRRPERGDVAWRPRPLVVS